MTEIFSSTSAATVSVQALSCGRLTLPEHQFVKPSSLKARRTVPSLAFLIQHTDSRTGKLTRILFDLGLRRDLKRYPLPIQEHIKNRQPITTEPDVTKQLAQGGLTPDDIDYVIYSHVHWDHIGEPHDFPNSTFIVGHGALALLSGKSPACRGGHSFFESDLLPASRTIELSDPCGTPQGEILQEDTFNWQPGTSNPETLTFTAPWRPAGPLPQTLDLFSDSSLLVVNAPGHLQGHINLLAQTAPGHAVYLGGDACHDRRLLSGEKEIGEWTDQEGRLCCIHVDRAQAEQTIRRIRELERGGVEVIFAHDVEWEGEPRNGTRFFGAG